MPTTPPALSTLNSWRMPGPSARTWVTRSPSSARTRRRKASPTADSGGRYRIASGVRMASHRSEEHTSELQSLMRISYAVFCLQKNIKQHSQTDDSPPNIQQHYTIPSLD